MNKWNLFYLVVFIIISKYETLSNLFLILALSKGPLKQCEIEMNQEINLNNRPLY